MRSIDVHAHITPQVFFRAVDSGADWHTIRLEKNKQGHEMVVCGPQQAQVHPKSRFSPELRITDMDSLGVDVQVLSTHSESALRFLIDSVGADRVVLGTDWPYDMGIDWPTSWVMEMTSLTPEERELIMWKNMERLLKTQY